ncbi:Ig-like domain-containing protein [Hyphobacterium sp.]|uniref:Ig-like domain-containing protein n=1 Tax=Hyphobacterium sp. TaxID=2004662 RepID=UPI003BA969A3
MRKATGFAALAFLYVNSGAALADPPVLGGLADVTAQESEVQGAGVLFPLFSNVTVGATNSLQGGSFAYYGLAQGDFIYFRTLEGSDLQFRTAFSRVEIYRGNTRLGFWQPQSIDGLDGITIEADITPETLQEIIRSIHLFHQPDPPVEQRRIFLRVTDAEGEFSSEGTTIGFGEASATPPFETPAGYAVGDPALGDLDNDGDLDMVLGRNGAVFDYFENTGSVSSPTFVQRSGAANPFDGIDLGLRGRAALGDLDNDGDLDFIAGDHTGLVEVYLNTGSQAAAVFERLDTPDGTLHGQDFGDLAEPHIADFSGDGLPDVTVGTLDGNIRYFLNTTQNATLSFAEHTGAANPFEAVEESGRAGPSLTSFDFDGDGDLELLVAWQSGGALSYFENTGTAASPLFVDNTGFGPQSRFGNFGDAGLAVADLNQDSLLDLVAARFFSGMAYHPGSNTVPRDPSLLLTIIPENDPPRGGNVLVRINEDAGPFDLGTSLRGVIVDNEGDAWDFESVDLSNTNGAVVFNSTTFTYDPEPFYQRLGRFEQETDSLTYTVTDTNGASSTFTMSIQVPGANDPMTANDDRIEISEDGPALEFIPLVLANDSDPDENDRLNYRFDNTTGLRGLIEFRSDGVVNGRVYDPNGAFETLALGESDVDRFTYTVRDSGSTTSDQNDQTANVEMIIIGANDRPVADDDSVDVALWDAERNITNELLDGDSDIDNDAVIAITAIDATSARGTVRFENGQVFYSPGAGFVELINGGTSTDRFVYTLSDEHGAFDTATVTVNVSNGPLLRSAVLPTTRSGVVGGDVFTAFATVLNGPGDQADGCRISVDPGAPVSMTYRQVDAANQPIGAPDPVFSIPANAQRSFVLAFTPQTPTTGAGVDLPVRFSCDEGSAPVFEGVNTLLVSISATPIADVIAIGATPTSDGVLRVPANGGRQAMAAAAINIGAPETLNVSLDNGFGMIPSSFTLCQTDENGVCLAPRAPGVDVNMAADPALFSILAVDSDGDQTTVPDDPANARLYLRFRDAAGQTRGLTSVGYTTGPFGLLDSTQDTGPYGVWQGTLAVDSGQGNNGRSLLVALPGNRLMLINRNSVGLIDYSPGIFNARRRNLDGTYSLVTASGQATTGNVNGFWFPGRQIQLQLVDQSGSFSVFTGTIDQRSFTAPIDLSSPQLLAFGEAAAAQGVAQWEATATVSNLISLTYTNPVTGNDCSLSGNIQMASVALAELATYVLSKESCADAGDGETAFAIIYQQPDENGVLRLRLAYISGDRAFYSVLR